jgi:hypothetical protein
MVSWDPEEREHFADRVEGLACRLESTAFQFESQGVAGGPAAHARELATAIRVRLREALSADDRVAHASLGEVAELEREAWSLLEPERDTWIDPKSSGAE